MGAPNDANACLPPRTDEDLVHDISTGSQEALETLIRRYAPRLGVLMLRIAGRDTNRSDIEEAVADCFVTVWRMAPSFDPKRAPAVAWVMHIAHYRALTLRRTTRRRQLELVGNIDSVIDERESADDGFAEAALERVASKEQLRGLREAFAGLTSQDIRIIRRRFVDQLTAQEIAVELGLSPNSVRVRLSRALARLRRGLAALNGGETGFDGTS